LKALLPSFQDAGVTMDMQKSSLDEAFQQELQRRLVEIDKCSEKSSGAFNYLDWIISLLFFIILPLFLVWLFRS